MSAHQTSDRVMALATGESRPITQFFDGGAFNCPWCGSACMADAVHCENPMCLASKFWTADQVRAEQEKRARHAAELAARVSRERQGADMARRYREARDQKWANVAAQAEERGACVTCLRKSNWEFGTPKFTKHRAADFHANDRRRVA